MTEEMFLWMENSDKKDTLLFNRICELTEVIFELKERIIKLEHLSSINDRKDG